MLLTKLLKKYYHTLRQLRPFMAIIAQFNFLYNTSLVEHFLTL